MAGPRVACSPQLPAGKSSLDDLGGIGLLARALDESAEITDGEVQREVNGGEQLDEEQIPAQ